VRIAAFIALSSCSAVLRVNGKGSTVYANVSVKLLKISRPETPGLFFAACPYSRSSQRTALF